MASLRGNPPSPFFLSPTYTIWSWKGDYINLGAGTETAVYVGEGPHVLVDKSLAMQMSLKLENTRTGETYFDYHPEKDVWWPTAFDPSSPMVPVDELRSTTVMDFSTHPELFEGFYNEYRYRDDSALTFDPVEKKVTITW